MFSTFTLARIFGIEVKLHWSWSFIFLLVTWTFASGLLEDAYPEWSDFQRWLGGAVASIIFFGSILMHELSHSLVARRYGIPVSSITLFVFGGVSSLGSEPKSAHQEFWIAIVGPLTSFAAAAVFGVGYLAFSGVEDGVADVSARLGLINVALGVFNLVPGYPLDGGRVLRSLFWARRRNILDATRLASRVGELVAYGLMGLGLVMLFWADVVGGLWLLLIGNFLRAMSAASYQQMVTEQALQGVPARRLARKDYVEVDPSRTITDVVEEVFLTGAARYLPVTDAGRLVGILTLSDVRRVPRDQWDEVFIGHAMTPWSELKVVGTDNDLSEVLKLLAGSRLNQIPVAEDGEFYGMIDRADIIEFIEARQLLDPRFSDDSQAEMETVRR